MTFYFKRFVLNSQPHCFLKSSLRAISIKLSRVCWYIVGINHCVTSKPNCVFVKSLRFQLILSFKLVNHRVMSQHFRIRIVFGKIVAISINFDRFVGKSQRYVGGDKRCRHDPEEVISGQTWCCSFHNDKVFHLKNKQICFKIRNSANWSRDTYISVL